MSLHCGTMWPSRRSRPASSLKDSYASLCLLNINNLHVFYLMSALFCLSIIDMKIWRLQPGSCRAFHRHFRMFIACGCFLKVMFVSSLSDFVKKRWFQVTVGCLEDAYVRVRSRVWAAEIRHRKVSHVTNARCLINRSHVSLSHVKHHIFAVRIEYEHWIL